MTEYQRTLQWLYTLEAAKGMDFKLERVALALRSLGEPHLRFPSLHIAGTNGKGSVAATLHAVLGAAGYRVGLYVSPHLVRFTERIRVGSEEISEAEVVALAAKIQRTVTSRGIDLTFFEFVTVMGLLHFARAAVDVAVIEVGLGGRLDATNVIDPMVSVITTIGHDHGEYLGNSLASIAAEKGGIIKRRRPVVLGLVGGRAAAVLRQMAAACAAPVFQAGRDYGMSADPRPTFRSGDWVLPDLTIALRGGYQRDNAATALACLAQVRDRFPISESALRIGLASVRWPGRLEIVAHAPLTILDGAHNPEGMTALTDAVTPLVRGRRVHALFAVMRDKRWRTMVERLAPLCDSVTVTEVQPPRGLSAAVAAAGFRRYCPTTAIPDPLLAFAAARERAGTNDAVLVAGSLFLVGAVLPLCANLRVAGTADPAGPVCP